MPVVSGIDPNEALFGHANMQSVGQSAFSSLRSFFLNMLPYGSLIDSGISLISGIVNNIRNRNLQQELWNRDDTQMDRLMAQYQRNGINPLLSVPQVSGANTKGFEPNLISTNFGSLEEQRIARESAKRNNQLLDEQLKGLKEDNRFKRIQNRALEQGYMYNWRKKFGNDVPQDYFELSKGESDLEKLASGIYNYLSGHRDEIQAKFDEVKEKVTPVIDKVKNAINNKVTWIDYVTNKENRDLINKPFAMAKEKGIISSYTYDPASRNYYYRISHGPMKGYYKISDLEDLKYAIQMIGLYAKNGY